MAGTTSPLAFPYPTGTDRVADGDNAIQALAEAVDDHLSGWGVYPPLDPNIANNGDGTIVYRRGTVGTLIVECIVSVGWNDSWALMTVPVGFRPAHRVFIPCATNIGTTHHLYLTTDGFVKAVVSGIPAGTPLWGTMSYPLFT